MRKVQGTVEHTDGEFVMVQIDAERGIGIPVDPDLENRFTYHAPKEGQPAKYTAIREECKRLAYMIKSLVPAGREQSLALTSLEDCMMRANAGIARSK